MEVHQHTHIPRKKWNHYFWEFLMLFLAVFFGFLAEYQLEHKIERDREKQYMKSLIIDLQYDTMYMNNVIDLFTFTIQMEDSLQEALLNPDVLNNASIAYRYIGFPLRGSVFERSEGTIQQLKNAGGWRLLHSEQVINQLNRYDEAYRRSHVVNELIREHYIQYINIFYKVVNADLVEQPYNSFDSVNIGVKAGKIYQWNSTDPHEIKSLYNAVKQLRFVTKMYVVILSDLREKAIDLIGFLEKKNI